MESPSIPFSKEKPAIKHSREAMRRVQWINEERTKIRKQLKDIELRAEALSSKLRKLVK